MLGDLGGYLRGSEAGHDCSEGIMLIQVTDGVYLLNVSVWLCCYYREGVINTLRGGSVPFEWGVRINSCDFRGGL